MAIALFMKDENGQALVPAAIMFVVVLGFVGFAVDVGQMRLTERQMQIAADSAAMAASIEISNCAGVSNCSAMQSAVKSALAENGIPISALVENCSASGGQRYHNFS